MKTNNLLNMLSDNYIKQTELENSPHYFEVNFVPNSFNINKYLLISRCNEEFDKFVNECMTEYNINNLESLLDYIYINPSIWTKIALKIIIQGYTLEQTVLKFPNGCCSYGLSCPINKYYHIVLQNLLLDKQEKQKK
jgi:hypothetical protein